MLLGDRAREGLGVCSRRLRESTPHPQGCGPPPRLPLLHAGAPPAFRPLPDPSFHPGTSCLSLLLRPLCPGQLHAPPCGARFSFPLGSLCRAGVSSHAFLTAMGSGTRPRLGSQARVRARLCPGASEGPGCWSCWPFGAFVLPDTRLLGGTALLCPSCFPE